MARYLAFLLGAMPAGSDAMAVLARRSLEEMWQPVLPIGRGGGEHIGLGFFVHELDGERFFGHTGGQRDFVSFFYVHPGSRTGALGAFNSSTAGLSLRRDAAPAVATWEGFGVRVDARSDECAVVVTAPTAGHELLCERAVLEGDTAVLDLRLTKPGDDEMVAMVVSDLPASLPADVVRGARRVKVRIALWQRGVHYFRAPDHVEAATLKLR
jgi:hypothetical protein